MGTMDPAVAGSDNAMERAFLGVRASLLGRGWQGRLNEAAAVQAVAIGQMHGLPDILARVLAGRGQDAATASAFLIPKLRDAMPNPAVLRGMAEAVARLAHAAQRRECVAIFGDYDVDGACSAALLAAFLRAAGCPVTIHIPDRVAEGYGPNIPAIQALRRQGAALLVAVDCGTTSFASLEAARACGLDTVVIDHHQAEAELPPCVAVVNPNRQDDLSGLGHLCAAGVVFLVLVALKAALHESAAWLDGQAPDLLASLDLVALATVADVVPLVGLNRAFVEKGLAVMRLRRRVGLAALVDVAGAGGPPTAFHLGFLLGPRINAGGRIGDAGLGARLLLTDDPSEARVIAEKLDALNRDRRVIEQSALEDAEAAALRSLGLGPEAPAGVLVASGEGWHPGVVGLVAARLRERYDRPAFAITVQGAVATGSGRSIPGVDLGRAVRAAVAQGLLIKGGGHAMAAGVTLDPAKLPAFTAFLADACGPGVAAAREGAQLLVDAVLAAGAATPALVETLDRAAPFGSGNPDPVVAFARHRIVDVGTAGEHHLRLATVGPDGVRLDAIAFRVAGSAFGAALAAARGSTLHLAGTLTINRWGGAGRAELRLLDAATPQSD